jgi:POT family proton-dependent oligopeptide transporter
MISITGLEFSYTQAPRKMKSFIMSLWLLTVAAGNLFTALVNLFIQKADGSSRLDGPAYYWFFGAVLAVAAVLFIFVARIYRGRTYIQDGT